MTRRARVAGTGSSVGNRLITNADLMQWMDTTEEWIEQRTGIRERRWIDETQRPSSLARDATLACLDQAGLEVSDVDCILLATLSGEHDFPGTSFFLHEALDAGDIPCIDLRAQCSGFIYAMQMADALICAGRYDRVLVVGAEVHSTGLDVSTEGRDVSVIFGDGAGALLLEAVNTTSPTDPALLAVRVHAEGKHARKLWTEAPSSARFPRIDHAALDARQHFPYMDGRFVFKHAVTRMPEVLLATLGEASVKPEDVDLFLFHQANLRINEFVAQKLAIPAEKVRNNIQRLGNCSAAALPILLAEASRDGGLEAGQLVSLTAFGSGFTWGSAVLRWG
jgi:3-oxoacyl-[acyl-carrier-protein] synthase-3